MAMEEPLEEDPGKKPCLGVKFPDRWLHPVEAAFRLPGF